MKKTFLLASLATLMLSSCSLLKSTSTSVAVGTSIQSRNTADLVVSPKKISQRYIPTKQERAGGLNFVVTNATAAALRANNNADVLVAPQYDANYKVIFGHKKIKSVTVYGYPATYTNIRPAKEECVPPCPNNR